MKILMINPSSAKPENRREYILGIPYLLSTLKSNGHTDVHALNFFNMPWSETRDMTIKALEDVKPDVVLLSCFTINRTAGVKTALLAKEHNPSVKVVMGGMHPSFMYRQLLTNYPVDAVCIGEGEATIVELIEAFENNGPLDSIKGLAIKKDGQVITTGRRDLIKDLDTIPFPAHELYADEIRKTKKAHIVTSRGCPYGCNFCSTTEFWGRSWRARSSKNVVDEIEMLVREYGVEYISFEDDEYTLQKKRTIELSKEILDRGIKVKWSCSTRVNTIDREQLEWMTKSGCDHVAFGVESGSPKIIKNIGKKITNEQIIKAFELLDEFGLSRGAYLMVGNPGEDRKTVGETIQLIKRLGLDITAVAVAELYPGTQFYDLAKKKGFITDDYWLTENPPPFFTVEHTAEKLQWWSFLIVFNSQLNQGYLKAGSFILWFALSKKRKILNYAKRVLRKGLGLKTGSYTFKDSNT